MIILILTINHKEEEQCSKAAGHHPLEDINYTMVRGSFNLLQDLNLNNGRCSTAAESQNVAGYRAPVVEQRKEICYVPEV